MTGPTRDIVLPIKRTRGETLRERLSENAYDRILPARYLRRNGNRRLIESPEDLFRRVADAVAAAEKRYGNDPAPWAERYHDLMSGLEFMPNSPTLMNAGTDRPQLAACFVISPEDSMDSIFTTLKHAAVVMQSGGGMGYSFSALRPAGDPVSPTGGEASGPVSFMVVYDTMCEQIRQGGKRRGAQMGVLRVDHPDIARFVTVKRREGALSNFNLSVAVTDGFHRAVREDADYDLINPRTGAPHEVTESTASFYSPAYETASRTAVESNLWRDYGSSTVDIDRFRSATDLAVGEPMCLPARFVWTLVVDGAWRNGEPGLFVIDEANREHSFDVDRRPEHRIAATNPCGEQELENFEACTLGHVNLSLMAATGATPWLDFVDDRGRYTPEIVRTFLDQSIDTDRLDSAVRDGTRFLDDVVTISRAPVPAIDRRAAELRKIGLGIMGFAELLVQLGVRYGSPPSIEMARQLMARIDRVATDASHDLAHERGVFPEWPDSKYADPTAYSEWFERHTGHRAADWPDGYPIRNHSVTSIAPTGTTGMIANTSGGCEPLFNVLYFKNVSEDVQGEEMLVEFEDYFLDVLGANGLDPDAVRDEALSLLHEGRFAGPRSLSIPTPIADLFVTAGEIPATDHVRMQAAFQEHVDGAISKTVNFPADATHQDASEAFHLAVDLGCKGITVYRDRSRKEQVLTTEPSDPEPGPGGTPPDARCCPP